MFGPDPQWRERCDRYFSSMVDANHTETTASKSHSKDKQKKKKKEKKYRKGRENEYRRFYEGPSPFQNNHAPRHVTTFTSKAEPLKGLIRWLSVLDLHGTSMLLRGRSLLYCLFWIISSVLALAVFGVFVFIFVSDYFDDTTTFKVCMSQESVSPSPLSLVICNANLLRMSAVSPGSRFFGLKNLTVLNQSTTQTVPTQSPRDLLDGKELKEFLELVELDSNDLPFSDLQAEFSLYSGMVSDSDWDAVVDAALRLNFDPFPKALRMTASEMRSLGTDMKSDVLQCTKNGRQCQSGELTSELFRDLGNCAVVHLSLEDSWFSTADLTMDVTEEEYIPRVSPDIPGIQVFLRTSSDHSPLSPGQGVYVAAGETLQLSLRKIKVVKRLEDAGQCVSEITYSRSTCERQCLELHAARVCGCSLGLDNPLAQRCRVSVQYEFICYRVLEILAEKEKIPCECKPNCREEFVQVSATSHSWITEQSQMNLRQTLNAIGFTRNFTDFSKSISKIKVKMMRGDYKKLEEEREMSLLQLLMNLGAISALTCGVSMLTAVELVWIFGKILTVMCCAVMKKEERDDQVEFLPPPSMTRPSHLYDHPDTYRWVAYTGNGLSYSLHNQPVSGDMTPAILMMPPPPRDYPGAGTNHFHALSNSRNFYFRGTDMRRTGRGFAGHGNLENLSMRSGESGRDGRDKPDENDADSNMLVDEVLDDSDLRHSPRVAVVAAPTALFSHPWERPGRSEPHRTVLNTSQPGDGPAGMPLFNVPVPPPLPGGSGAVHHDDDLRLHGLDKLSASNSSSSDDEGNMAPRSSSPLYRVEQSFGPKARIEGISARKEAKEAKPAMISNGEIPRPTKVIGTDVIGSARPDGPGVESQGDQNQHGGKGAGRSKKTAWTEVTRQPSSQTGYGVKRKNISEPYDKGAVLPNGHIVQHGAAPRPQFFPRATPIQPNTWYVPEFQRMEFYDGRHSHVQPSDGPGYFVYQGGVNGHI